jgi:hypothetical protein
LCLNRGMGFSLNIHRRFSEYSQMPETMPMGY